MRTFTLALLFCSVSCQPHSASLGHSLDAGAERIQSAPSAAPAGEGREQRFARLLAQYDERRTPELAQAVDRAAGQLYATVSRLYWHVDLEEAMQRAQETGKPILSLRLLGRLDEELSCANSRFFRVVLYSNRELSSYLRDNFILHWASERPAPKVTIDYGDGRILSRTLTGNSLHYVLDERGTPVDALPGLYAPEVFRRELSKSLSLVKRLGRTAPNDRAGLLAKHHRAAASEREKQARSFNVPGAKPRLSAPVAAQLLTMGKSSMEMPMLRRIELGTELGPAPDPSPKGWAQAGARLHTELKPRFVQKRKRTENSTSFTVLDRSSRDLIERMKPMNWKAPLPTQITGDSLKLTFASIEQLVLADTAKNEFGVRPKVRNFFIDGESDNLEDLNRRIYAEVFLTPRSDPWLGLAPSIPVLLDRDGLTHAR